MRCPFTRWTVSMALGATLALSTAVRPAGAQEGETEVSPRPIALQDILDWKRISGGTLSKDGSWFAYRLSPTEGDSEVVVRSTSDDTEHRFPVGEVSGGMGSPEFSDDSRWLAFTVYPTVEEGKKDREGRQPARNSVGLVDLSTGEMTEVEDIRSFSFAGERGGWIALNRYPPEAGQSMGGSRRPEPGPRRPAPEPFGYTEKLGHLHHPGIEKANPAIRCPEFVCVRKKL